MGDRLAAARVRDGRRGKSGRCDRGVGVTRATRKTLVLVLLYIFRILTVGVDSQSYVGHKITQRYICAHAHRNECEDH